MMKHLQEAVTTLAWEDKRTRLELLACRTLEKGLHRYMRREHCLAGAGVSESGKVV